MEKPTKQEVADGMAMIAEELAAPGNEGETLKQRFMRYVGALFFEKKDGKWTISIGRISWWLVFVPALYIWIDGMGTVAEGAESLDITDHHMTALITLAGYNMGKHIKDAIAKKMTSQDGPG